MTSLLPLKLQTHIPLSVLFDKLGRHYFGLKWSGSEKNAAEMPSLEEAREMFAEQKKLTEKVEKRFDRSDDEYLAFIEFTTDEEEYVLYETDKEEYDIRIMVSRLIRLRDITHFLPTPDDAAIYNTQHDAFSRKNIMEATIKELLINQQLSASHRTEKGREIIPADSWTSTTVKLNLANETVNIQDKQYSKIEFETEQAHKIISLMPSAGTVVYQNKKAAEQEAYKELVALMQLPINEKATKPIQWPYFQKKYHPHLSNRAFSRLWFKAAQETKSGLDRAGRRRGT